MQWLHLNPFKSGGTYTYHCVLLGLGTVATTCTNCFRNKKLYTLSTQHIYVFHMILIISM
jgi:hypothetical protein